MRARLQSLTGLIRRHVERLDGEVSDASLLTRFLESRDEAAFDELLHRYGAMVFGVCRRALPTAADAEDAFQATFLSLVRKARTVERGGALGGWLYTTATRSAREIARRNRRREAREFVAARVESGEIVSSGDGEVARILDEELTGLPPEYRDPLVLCRVRGLTMAAAASELGLSVAGVWKRLQRGEDMLRTRLLRRGVTAPVGFAAVWFVVSSAQASQQLHELVRAAVARECAASAWRFHSLAWFCLGGITVAGAVGFLFLSPREMPAGPNPPANVAKSEQPVRGTGKFALPNSWLSMRGTVTDADGRPVPNVRVEARVPVTMGHRFATVAETTADANGNYAILLHEIIWSEADSMRLVAVGVPGQTASVPILPPYEETRTQFPIRLRKVDAEKKHEVTGQVTAADTRKPIAAAFVEIETYDRVLFTRTDNDGRYALTLPGVGPWPVRVTPSRAAPLLGHHGSVKGTAGKDATVANFSLKPGKVLSGDVVESAGRTPVVGAEVRFLPADIHLGRGANAVQALTDAEGRYTIAIPPDVPGTLTITGANEFRRLVRNATKPHPIPAEGGALVAIAKNSKPEIPTVSLLKSDVIRGVVSLPDGTPLASGSVWCLQKYGSSAPRSLKPLTVVDGRFTLPACTPGDAYDIAVISEDGQHAGSATLKVANHAHEIVLKPAYTD